MTDSNEFGRIIRVDNHLESYRSFFHEDRWVEEMHNLADKTMLKRIVFDLTSSWKAIGSVREMPWLLMHSIKAALESEFPRRDPLILRIVTGLQQRLESGMGAFRLSNDQRRQLLLTLQTIKEQSMAVMNASTRDNKFVAGFSGARSQMLAPILA